MDQGEPPQVSVSYWIPKRLEILSWMGRNAPSLGELFRGAVDLMYGNLEVAGKSRFIAHAVREIRNRLPDSISGSSSTRVDYVNHLDDIGKLWQREGLPIDGSYPNIELSESPTPGINIPTKAYILLSKLVGEHLNNRQKSKQIAEKFFMDLDPENIDFIDQIRPTIIQWDTITKWFIKYAHDSGKIDSEIVNEEFKYKFELFEMTLGSLLGNFYSTTEELDAILSKANS